MSFQPWAIAPVWREGSGPTRPAITYLEQVKGMDTGCVVVKGTTGAAYIINSEERDRSIVLFPGSANELSHKDLDRERLAGARWMHMTSLRLPAKPRGANQAERGPPGQGSLQHRPGRDLRRHGQRDFSAARRGRHPFHLEERNRAALRARHRSGDRAGIGVCENHRAQAGQRRGPRFS